MKRLILYALMMAVTFALGIGIHELIWQRQVDSAPTPQVEEISPAPLDPQTEFVPTVTSTIPLPTLLLDYYLEKVSPTAAYYIMGPMPKEFADFEALEIMLGHVDPDNDYIRIDTYNDDSAPAVFGLVTERRLFFVTSQMRNSDVEYRFDGKFLRTHFNAAKGKDVPVLRGTLTKTKNGRKIAERTFSFRIEHRGC